VTEQQAADLCWSLMDGLLYRRLVIQRGLTTADLAQWLAHSLAATLMRPAGIEILPGLLRGAVAGIGYFQPAAARRRVYPLR
jgi:hypothetical protein